VVTRGCECRHICKGDASEVDRVFVYGRFRAHPHTRITLEVALIPKPQDCSPISLRRARTWCRVKVHHRLALGGDFCAQFTAGVGFLIKSLRHGCGPSRIAQLKHFDLEISTFGSDLQHVADVNIAPRLHLLALALNPTEFACASSHAAGFEKPRCPKPFVETHASHFPILTVHEALPHRKGLRT